MKSGRKRFAFGAGLAISAFFLFLAFRGLQPEQFFSSLSEVNPPLLLSALLIYLLAVVVIALRWQFLLRAIKAVPLAALSQLVFIGYMGNNAYPLRAGDALRIALLRRNFQVPLLPATTVVVIERLFDGSVMLAFVLFSLLFIDLQAPEIEAMLGLTTPLFIAAMFLAFFLAAKPSLLRQFARLALARLPGRLGAMLARVSEDIITGLEGLRSPLQLAGAVISSFVTWGIEAATYWLVLHAFGLGGLEASYAVALLLVGAVNLAGLIPASPGQVGVSEFVVITILTALGIPKTTATGYAVVVHLVIWLPVTSLGFFFLLRQGLGWADIGRASDLESAAQG